MVPPSPLPVGVPTPSLEVLGEVLDQSQAVRARRVRLHLTGPSQMNLVLPGSIISWSFATALPVPRHDCGCHLVFLATGTPSASWTFELTLPTSTHGKRSTLENAR